ncbi:MULTISPECIES: Hsp20/alpha crystallin family protein [Bacillaceae]|uniref:Hsp20/alpha crystallin family protein n=1 Tax=Bacillaceae TaxID=186817 RepID=UPI001C58ED70|nr:Hsp20/alpha crystallin family protein [Rossellomorea sp. YZS02]MBW3113274.1 Hsp20/alpha crystallin family protein [Bacillus sp. MCCB 382]MDX8343875.1 Hsp20/alpha crystallin family protein [Rossellomorea sp. YZS02]
MSNDSSNRKGFGDLMHSMNEFFHERPMKGMLQSIDEFFTSSANPFGSFPVKMTETDDHYVVTAELPGVNKEQIQLDVFPQYITISVTNKGVYSEENEKHQTIKRKQSISKSSRTVPFPTVVNEKNVKASYKDGLLSVKVNKESGKRIQIE